MMHRYIIRDTKTKREFGMSSSHNFYTMRKMIYRRFKLLEIKLKI